MKVHTWGGLAEQPTSSQTLAHNHGFFKTAFNLYMHEGALKRGAASKPKKLEDREPGDRTGFGSIRRLAIALQRLDLTYDTAEMHSEQITAVLPKEFARWSRSE